jgi:hypothetical protein
MTDPHEKIILDDVKNFGWHAVGINDDPAGAFVYTVGLMETANHPEICIFGLRSDSAHQLLSAMVRIIREGQPFMPGERFQDHTRNPFRIDHVSQEWHTRFFGYAMWHCRHRGKIGSLQMMQVLWSDDDGRFPGEPHCNPQVMAAQPVLRDPPHKHN